MTKALELACRILKENINIMRDHKRNTMREMISINNNKWKL